MKPDYKNWMPKGMVLTTVLVTVVCLVLFMIFGLSGITAGALRIVLFIIFLILTVFWLGVLSGAVEPVFGGVAILVASLVVPAMPYFLTFASGAMLYVVVEELIPEMSAGEHSNIGVLFFAVGFSLMMALDVALG